MNDKSVVIVAGGKGLRMGVDLPKQFIPIGGQPILMHTIQSFFDFDKDIQIILVLPLSHQDYWNKLCEKYNFHLPYIVTTGGETRFHSVKNGLELVKNKFVAIQDGARPFASKDLIARCFQKLEDYDAIIPVINATDSLREMIDCEKSKIIDRSKIKLVQTPQVFRTDVLKTAYEREYQEAFTDDASVVEATGVNVHLVEGETSNIKITTMLDLKISEFLLQK